MEKLCKVDQPMQKNPGKQREENDKIQDGELQVKQESTDEGKTVFSTFEGKSKSNKF